MILTETLSKAYKFFPEKRAIVCGGTGGLTGSSANGSTASPTV
jgi:hypothetical protein